MAEFGIASRLVAPKIDPLAIAGQAQQVQAGALNNRLLNQNVQQTMAQRAAAQGSIVDGKFDPEMYTAKLGEGGASPEALAAAQQQKLAQIQEQIGKLGLSSAELELTGKRWKKIGDVSKALLAAKGPDGQPAPLTTEAVSQAMKNDLISSGLFHDKDSQSQVVSFLTNLPQDPAAIREALTHVGLQSDMTSEGIAGLLGTPGNVNTGSHVVSQQVSPLTGEMRVNGQLATERTPGEKATLVPTYNPATGKTELQTSGGLIGDAGPGAPKGPVAQAGPALGEAEAASGAVKQFADLRATAEKAPEVKAALTNIRDTIGSFKPGVKTNWAYTANALATQLGVASPKMQNEAAAQEEFNKLATQFINQQVGALGGTGTDSKLESARHGAPNEFMTRQGIQNVTSLMLGLNDALAAKNSAAQRWVDAGNPPSSYGKFVEQFNKLYDPRVFQSQYMDDAQKQNMLKGMTKDERAEFQSHWTAAKKFGWIK